MSEKRWLHSGILALLPRVWAGIAATPVVRKSPLPSQVAARRRANDEGRGRGRCLHRRPDCGAETAALFAFTDSAQRARWSTSGWNLRAPGCLGDLNDQQRGALMDLLGTVLSPTGTQMVKQQMDAGRHPQGGRRSRAGGRVSAETTTMWRSWAAVGTSPWMLQFGGHHLAINATVVGANSPVASLTGGQPVPIQQGWEGR